MSEITRRQFLRGAAMAAGAAVLTACTPAASPTTAPATGGQEAPKATEAAPAAGATATTAPAAGPAREKKWPMGDIPRNKTLVYSYGTLMAGVHSPLATGYNHQIGNAFLYEPCAYYGAHADKTYMWLAESYQYNDKATELTIKFRKGIKWSDGKDFTAKDPVWAMTKLKTVDGLNKAVYYKSEVDKVEATDDQTLHLTFNQTDWRFFFKSLTYRYDLGDDTALLPPQMFDGVADKELVNVKGFDAAKGWPISTGPYGVSQSTDQFCYYDLRPTWWALDTGFADHEPAPWRVLYQAFQNDTVAAQQLINNEIDQSLDLRPLVVASILAQCDHVTTWTGNKPPFGYTDWWPISVVFNCAQAPTNDPKVRWALSYAIDRDNLVATAWGGAGKPSLSIFPEFKKLNEYVAGIQDIYDKHGFTTKADLKKVESLMTEAGYKKNADGFWADKDGNLPNFDLYGAVPLFGDLAPVLAEMFRTAGFKSEHKSPQDVWAAMTDGRANLFLFGHGGSTIDPYDTFMLYRKENILPIGQQSWSNLPRWSDDNFQKITDQMNNLAMDDPKMKDLFHQGMEIFYDQLPDAPIVQWFHRIPVNTTYWTNWPTAENPYMNTALWHQTMFMVINGLQATNKS